MQNIQEKLDGNKVYSVVVENGEVYSGVKTFKDIQDEMEEFLDLVPTASYVGEVTTEEQEGSCYSAADMATAAAQGFRDGRAFR